MGYSRILNKAQVTRGALLTCLSVVLLAVARFGFPDHIIQRQYESLRAGLNGAVFYGSPLLPAGFNRFGAGSTGWNVFFLEIHPDPFQ